MQKISRIIAYKPDELLLSWVVRLSAENGFDDPRMFIATYFYPNDDYKGDGLKADYRDEFELFWQALPHDRVSERELFFELTTFTGTAPFMSKEQRQRYLCRSFYKNRKLEALFPLPHGTATSVFICPKCAKKELAKNGEFYLHRSHQLPGVKVCYLHGCGLEEIVSPHLYTMTKYPATKPVSATNSNVQQEYAVFIKDFLNQRFDFSVETIANLIFEKLEGTGARKEKITALIKEISNSNLAVLFEDGKAVYYQINQAIPAGQYVDAEVAAKLLFYLYGSVQAIAQVCAKTENNALTIEKEYSIIGEYRDDIIEFQHLNCGKHFCVSPYGFSIGWKCPVCDENKTVDDKLQELVTGAGNGEYEILEQFKNNDTAIEFMHHKCGKISKIKPRAFLYEGVRCDCNHKIGYEGVKRNIEQFDGFALVRYTAIDKPLTIRHSCGNEFDFYYTKFMAAPRCRVCQRKGHLSKKTTKDFVEDVKALTGSEYTLVSDYLGPRKPVMIRHNVCGKTQQYKPFYFLDGARCKDCSTKMTDEQYKDYVSKYTCGQYAVTGRVTENLFEIRNTETGTIQRLGRQRILQELHRPTPSELLPLSKSNRMISKPQTKENNLLQRLKDLYGNNDLIFLEDVEIKLNTVSKEELQTTVANMTKRDRMVRVANGIYTFGESGISKERIIYEKYVVRQNKRIGYYRGNSFAYEIGIGEKPEAWSIATNKESYKTPPRKVTFLSEEIHIKGTPEPITDKNWLIYSVFDFLVQYRQYTFCQEEEVIDKIKEYIRSNNGGVLFSENVVNKKLESYKTQNIRTIMKRLCAQLVEKDAENL